MRIQSVGHILGVNIRWHPSMVLVVLWAAYQWGYVAGGSVTSIIYGVAFVSCVFGLVLAHELGHALMARQFGLKVRDITLLPFGGIARIERMPASPRVEALVAIAGPLTNTAIAIFMLPLLIVWMVISGFTSISDLGRYALHDPSFGGFVLYIFLANLLLAIVNLIPAFPMDGGRLLRAGLSTLVGRDRATKSAVVAGVVFAVVIGSIALLNGDLIVPLVSVLLVATAISEGRSVRLEQQLRRLQVGQFAVWDSGGLAPTDPVALALRDGPRDTVVTSNGIVLGMLWKSDLQTALQNGTLSKKAGEIMDRNVVSAEAGSSIFDVHTLMSENNQWTMPVTEHGTYRGIFSAERFFHVHQYLRSRTPENRHVASLTGSVSQTLKALVR
ncbi:site-2 protease family protein [soil metagenome]